MKVERHALFEMHNPTVVMGGEEFEAEEATAKKITEFHEIGPRGKAHRNIYDNVHFSGKIATSSNVIEDYAFPDWPTDIDTVDTAIKTRYTTAKIDDLLITDPPTITSEERPKDITKVYGFAAKDVTMDYELAEV